MAASSSATSIFPAGIGSSSGSADREGVVPCKHRHQEAEDGVSRLRLAFDDPTMIADDLGNQCKSEACSGRLGCHEWIEQLRQQVGRHVIAVVLYEISE